MSRIGTIAFVMSGIMIASALIVKSILGWVPFCWVALGMAALFGAVGWYYDRQFFKEFFAMKATKHGMSMGWMIILVIAFLSAINFLGVRRYKTWDFSLNQANSLSEQSIQLLKGLKEDLRVIFFYREGSEQINDYKTQFVGLIKKYQDQTPLVKLEFVEIDQNPALAEKYNIKKGSQSVLLEYKGRTNLIDKIDEQEITNALIKVTREKEKNVYIISGHGELPLETEPDKRSAGYLKDYLAGNQYTVKPFELSSGPIPADADVVIILGPNQPYQELDVKKIEAYLRSGGNVLLALEPNMKHGLEGLLKNLGLKVSNTYVLSIATIPKVGRAVDPKATAGNVFSPTHPITKPFGRQMVVFQQPQAILRDTAVPGIEIEDIVKTSDQSMSFPDMTLSKEGELGPFTMAVAVKGKYPGATENKEFNLVLTGDRDFASDMVFYEFANRDFFANSVSALAKYDDLISIAPREIKRTQLTLTDTQFKMFVFLFLIPIPIAFFFLGGTMWYRRRYS